jgi:hypothetical protein
MKWVDNLPSPSIPTMVEFNGDSIDSPFTMASWPEARGGISDEPRCVPCRTLRGEVLT